MNSVEMAQPANSELSCLSALYAKFCQYFNTFRLYFANMPIKRSSKELEAWVNLFENAIHPHALTKVPLNSRAVE